MPGFVERQLEGWGRYPRSVARVYRPEKISEVTELLADRAQRTYLARGLGRSYGDAALNGGQGIILTERFNRFIEFDRATGELTCEAGVTLEEILEVSLPYGWFPAVTPGTKFVSVGGAIACDVHGKNHHRDGSLSAHLDWIELVLADGRQIRCSPQQETDLFRATVGGMGLTGVILAAKLKLRPIQTAFIRVDYLRTEGLEETLQYLDREDDSYAYSVAWVDCLASGKPMGRSVLMRGNHCRADDLDAKQGREPLRIQHRSLFELPVDVPGFLLNNLTIRCLNALYYRRFKRGKSTRIEHYDPFFYPLDVIHCWNRAYGKRGFLQYQCVFPADNAGAALREALSRINSSGYGSFLAVLKRLGPQEGGLLSFPMAGYTLALDFPMRDRRLLDFLEAMDQLVLTHGGRVYLGKDARLSPFSFQRMYPHLPEWLKIRRQADPRGLFSSDLSRRLQLDGAAL